MKSMPAGWPICTFWARVCCVLCLSFFFNFVLIIFQLVTESSQIFGLIQIFFLKNMFYLIFSSPGISHQCRENITSMQAMLGGKLFQSEESYFLKKLWFCSKNHQNCHNFYIYSHISSNWPNSSQVSSSNHQIEEGYIDVFPKIDQMIYIFPHILSND